MTALAHRVFHTRPAVCADAEEIGAVHGEAWREAYRGLYPPLLLEAAAAEREAQWSAHLVDTKLEMGVLHVAEDQAGVSGFAFGLGHEVVGLYLHPRAWGTGQARVLLGGLVSELRSARLVLWTMCGAFRARAFYEANGWMMTGRLASAEFVAGHPLPIVEYAAVRCERVAS